MVSRAKKRRRRAEKEELSLNSTPTLAAIPKQIYQSLNTTTQEIRILTILGGDCEEIECEFEVFPLHDVQNFTACSYTWQSDELKAGEDRPRAVLVNQELVNVGCNLWEFMLNLRGRYGTIKVWIDYICINQSNTAEKNAQVRMMAEIFGGAKRVIAWIGASTSDSAMALDYIREAQQQRDAGVRKRQIDRDKYTVTAQKRMRDLVDRTFWTRLWIIQESVRAKQLFIMVDDEVLLWDTVAYWINEEYLENTMRLSTARSEARVIYLSIAEMRCAENYSIPLPELVDRFCGAACKDPRDKLYGLIGMIEPAVRQRISIDYSVPVLEAFLRTFHLWSLADSAERSQSRERKLSAAPKHRSAYHIGEVVSNLQKVCPYNSIEELRTLNGAQERLPSSLTIKCLVVSEKTEVRVVATVGGGRVIPLRDITYQKSAAFICTLNPPILIPETIGKAKVLYSTVIPQKTDILLIAGRSGFLVRKKGTHFLNVGTVLLINADHDPKKAPSPHIWTGDMMPNIRCKILDNTWATKPGPSIKITCHVEVNALGVAQICQNERTASWRKGAPRATWNLAPYLPASAPAYQEGETSSQIAVAKGAIDESNFGVIIVIQTEELSEIKAFLKRNIPSDISSAGYG